MPDIKFQLPDNPEIATKVIEADAQHATRRMEGGFVGKVFGLATEKPGNIAAFSLIVFSMMFGLELIYGSDGSSLTKKDALSIIGGFITLTLGFVFGRNSSGSD